MASSAAPVAALDGDDAALLSRVAKGDLGRPLEQLYHRYERRIFGAGLHLLGDRGLAEELVQETLLRLWKSAGRYDPARGSVSAYVMTIARRAAIDLYRRPSSRPFAQEAEPEITPEGRAGADPMDPVATKLAVREALGALSPEHRQVLELTLDRDLRQADIAALLGIPLGTVKTRMHYAMKGLKLALDERGIHG